MEGGEGERSGNGGKEEGRTGDPDLHWRCVMTRFKAGVGATGKGFREVRMLIDFDFDVQASEPKSDHSWTGSQELNEVRY